MATINLISEEEVTGKVKEIFLEIKDSQLFINGVSIKLKGVNRHDTHPDRGYAVTREDMLPDIRLMKEHNVITSYSIHYTKLYDGNILEGFHKPERNPVWETVSHMDQSENALAHADGDQSQRFIAVGIADAAGFQSLIWRE